MKYLFGLVLFVFMLSACSPGYRALLRDDPKIVPMYEKAYSTCWKNTEEQVIDGEFRDNFCRCYADLQAVYEFEGLSINHKELQKRCERFVSSIGKPHMGFGIDSSTNGL